MKLIGSRLEDQLLAELQKSHRALYEGRIGSFLACENYQVSACYVLNHIPEQCEDIYVILVSRDEVVVVEVPRDGEPFLVQRSALLDYERGRSKINRLRIAIARKLQDQGAV